MTEIKIHRPQIQKLNQDSKQNLQNVDTKRYIPKEVMDFATSMESQFSELMLKEMQKSSSATQTNSSETFYKDLLTTERSKAMAESSSRGLKDMILDEVYPQYKRTAQNYAIYEQQQNQFNNNKVSIHEGPTKQSIQKAQSTNLE